MKFQIPDFADLIEMRERLRVVIAMHEVRIIPIGAVLSVDATYSYVRDPVSSHCGKHDLMGCRYPRRHNEAVMLVAKYERTAEVVRLRTHSTYGAQQSADRFTDRGNLSLSAVS
jgi:hypothetical protein